MCDTINNWKKQCETWKSLQDHLIIWFEKPPIGLLNVQIAFGFTICFYLFYEEHPNNNTIFHFLRFYGEEDESLLPFSILGGGLLHFRRLRLADGYGLYRSVLLSCTDRVIKPEGYGIWGFIIINLLFL